MRLTGLTLIELALAQLLVGLAVSGGLKGMELLDTSKVESLVVEADSVRSALQDFKSGYQAVPGDDSGFPAEASLFGMADARMGSNGGGFGIGQSQWLDSSALAKHPVQYDALFAGSEGMDRLNLKTGSGFSAKILARIDQQFDDGRADRGNFRFSPYREAGAMPNSMRCYDGSTGQWKVDVNESNCGAAALL